ncbi:hypothetical protein O181_016521 [Austropuccinia psidii MF-1]|uniref:RNA-dependent RNA polymerase n=1 Tax=Austropuccinia psidii MF-1 TaxID=1389203 RepID=A0A9Q3C1V3_9BASI|nr:hypothetical protein [Austropuccinia psidii MF-1]
MQQESLGTSTIVEHFALLNKIEKQSLSGGLKRKGESIEIAEPKKPKTQSIQEESQTTTSGYPVRLPDGLYCTKLFLDQVDTKLSRLDNSLITWEVARSVFSWPLEDQLKALSTNLPPDPRTLDLSRLVPGRVVEDDYDPCISSIIDQIKHDMKSGPASLSPISQLLQSGQIRFTIRMVAHQNQRQIVLKPQPPRVISSNELLRTYGSDCFIHVHMAETFLFAIQQTGRTKGLGKLVWQFFNRPIRLAGRLYRAAFIKESSVWLFSSPLTFSKPLKIMNLIEQQVPLELNRSMKLSKFNARLQLALSTTSPSITFKPQHIRRVPDISSNSLRISKPLMEQIAQKLKLDYLPSAIQGAHKVVKSCYTGQRYTWALFDPIGLPSTTSMQVWNSNQLSSIKDTKITFEFYIDIYESSLRHWVEKSYCIEVSKTVVEILKDKRNDEAIMTDGAAAISWAAALKIKRTLGLSFLPAAFQARILRSKGLWYLSNYTDKEAYWIEIRSSQWKAEVHCDPDSDIMFNLCHFSTKPKAGQVNRQSMPVLASRKVPISTLTDHQKAYFKSTLDVLTSKDPMKLVHTLEHCGNLLPVKAERISTAIGGIRGQEDEDKVFSFEKYSKRPNHPTEEAVELLKSGFSPRHCRVVDRLILSSKDILDGMINFKLTIPSSTNVFVMPDPTGTLQEGEVFLQLSYFKDQETSLPISVLKGDCIVFRSPCVHPTDARKVRAVVNKHLLKYDGVLVCSVLGARSLLDFLSGGDYDGDKVTVIWDKSFTENFINADDPSDLVPFSSYDDYFSDTTSSVGSKKKGTFLSVSKVQSLYDLKEKTGCCEAELRKLQLLPLFQVVDFGRYSQMYKVSEYMFGVSHELTKKLGYVYVKCLDAAKTGLILKPEADLLLKEEFQTALGPNFKTSTSIPLPCWTKQIDLSKDSSKEWESTGQSKQLRTYLPLKIDHVLEAIAITAREERLHFMTTLKNLQVEAPDSALTEPWALFSLSVQKVPERVQVIWDFIDANVKKCWNQYRKAAENSISCHPSRFEEAWKIFWEEGHFSQALAAASDNALAYHFLQGKQEFEYNVLRASAIVSITPPNHFFPFHIAFHELCHLKARAEETNRLVKCGIRTVGHAPRTFSPMFNQAMMVNTNLLKKGGVQIIKAKD